MITPRYRVEPTSQNTWLVIDGFEDKYVSQHDTRDEAHAALLKLETN